MIERLKYLIDESENKPELKSIFLRIAQLPEDKQEVALQFVEGLLNKQEGALQIIEALLK